MTTATVKTPIDLLEVEQERGGMGRRYSVSLDGRPMGWIFQLNKDIEAGWNATTISGDCPRVVGVTKDEALAVLW